MSDAEPPPPEPETAPPPPETEIPGAVGMRPARPARRGTALVGALVGLAVLIVAVVASAPFWASRLPWGQAAADRRVEQQLGARLDTVGAAQNEMRQQVHSVTSEVQQLRHVGSETSAAVQQMDHRVGALETKPAPGAADIAEMRQELGKVSGSLSDLTTRLDALDKTVHAQTSHGAADAALALALLQIRDAVTAGRPFEAEYQTLVQLARGHAEIAQAADKLAEPAQSGVATTAVLAKGLRDLAKTLAAPKAAPAGDRWTDAVMSRLRGLVTIRRLDGAAKPNGPQGAVNAAELALAGGDLAGAVKAIGKLTGSAADAAAPWRRLAGERLAVDATLQKLAALLTAGLDIGAAPSGNAGPGH